MSSLNPLVGLAVEGNRRRNLWRALDLVRSEVVPKLADTVLLKPNFLDSKNPLVCTQVDAIRGVLDFLLSVPNPPRQVLIAEGANEQYSGESFSNFGYRQLAREYPVPIELIDLHQETRWATVEVEMADGRWVPVHMARTVLDCPCVISVAVAKTHDACIVTLALKNLIMGSLRQIDRIRIHGYDSHNARRLPREAQLINKNLIRVARQLRPHIGVIDGTVGIQGNGPGGKDVKPLGIAVASSDVIAADAVMAKAMGFKPADIGAVAYGDAIGLGVGDLNRIRISGVPLAEVIKPFKPHEHYELQRQWRESSQADLVAALETGPVEEKGPLFQT